MKIQIVKIKDIKPNISNPRVIKDEKFTKLVTSIKDFPDMLKLRPIIVNEDMMVLGGNMRLKACQKVGLKEVPIIKASDLTLDQQKEFIIKDNVGFGSWDWDILANEWNSELLNQWSMDVWQLDQNSDLGDFFEQGDDTENKKEDLNTIVLNYSQDDYNLIIEELKNHTGTKEKIFFSLLIN